MTSKEEFLYFTKGLNVIKTEKIRSGIKTKVFNEDKNTIFIGNDSTMNVSHLDGALYVTGNILGYSVDYFDGYNTLYAEFTNSADWKRLELDKIKEILQEFDKKYKLIIRDKVK